MEQMRDARADSEDPVGPITLVLVQVEVSRVESANSMQLDAPSFFRVSSESSRVGVARPVRRLRTQMRSSLGRYSMNSVHYNIDTNDLHLLFRGSNVLVRCICTVANQISKFVVLPRMPQLCSCGVSDRSFNSIVLFASDRIPNEIKTGLFIIVLEDLKCYHGFRRETVTVSAQTRGVGLFR